MPKVLRLSADWGPVTRRLTPWIVLLGSGPLAAQVPVPIDQPFLKAAIVIRAFDQAMDRCREGKGLGAATQDSINTWERANGVAAIRRWSNDATLEPRHQRSISSGASILGFAAKLSGPCAAAVSLTKIPDAQLATVAPALVAAAGGAAPSPESTTRAGAVAATPVDSTAPAGDPVGVDADASQAARDIEAFAFDTRMVMGVNGFLVTDVYPVVLFRNGDAVKDATAFAHRAARPERWTKWRRGGNRIELQSETGWVRLPFAKTYPALPPDFRLNGRFQAISGTGTVAIGGGESAMAWREYQFSLDGQVSRQGGAGAAVQGSESRAGMATSAVSRAKHGRYRVNGLLLEIVYDDGTRESRVLITDPDSPRGAIWLDGHGYSRKGR